jgi:adenylate cyclase
VRVFKVAVSEDSENRANLATLPIVPTSPSIAVLPFIEFGETVGRTYFGDGLVEDVVGALATLPEVFVISRNSTLKYRETPLNIRVVGEELGVRYVLSGSVRRRDEQLRISAELADTDTLRVIQSYRSDGAVSELFALQDRLIERIVQTIAPKIRGAELQRIKRKRPETFDAYDYLLRGLDLLYRLD